MKYQIALFVCFASLLFDSPIFAEDARKPVVTVMICEEGDEKDHYDAYNNMPPFMTALGKENNWDVTVLKSPKFAQFPDMEILDRTDVLVVYVRRIGLPKEQMQRVKKYVKDSGKGLLVLRTGCHGFHPGNGKMPDGCEDWKGFDREVLGGNYHGHGNNDIGQEVWNVKEQEKSSILKDVKPAIWHGGGSVYFNDPLAEGVTVYQYAGSSEKGKMPLTWTRMYGDTKVAYTALGHKTDFNVPAFKALIRNLVHWAADVK